MYEAIEGCLDASADDTIVWRYMNISKLESLLQTSALFFANMWVLARDDKYEGVYPQKNYDRVLEHLSALPPDADPIDIFSARASAYAHDELVRRSRTSSYASCWHKSEHESDAMWGKYLKRRLFWKLYLASDGIAVRSTIGGLRTCLRTAPGSQHIAAVSYIDYVHAPPEPNHAQLLLNKRLVFDYEKEVRLLAYDKNPPELFEGTADGIFVPVVLEDLIDEIYVSPKSSDKFMTLVTSLLATRGVSKPVKRSQIDIDPPTAGAALTKLPPR
jgi:hypothetical protein